MTIKDYRRALPYHGYQDNEVVGWVVSSIQETGIDPLISDLEGFQEGVASRTLSDYTATYLGLLSIGLWDQSWPDALKADILEQAADLLQSYGTRASVALAMTTLVPGYVGIWEENQRILLDTSTLPATFGQPTGYHFQIIMGPETTRDSVAWKTAELVAHTLTPAFVDTSISYDGFYLGISVMGDRLFS